jgi:hypothetical protein
MHRFAHSARFILALLALSAGCGGGGGGDQTRVLVGTLPGSDSTFIGIVADDSNVIAYVCDSTTTAIWFDGAVIGDRFELNDSGAAITGIISGSGIQGSFNPSGGAGVPYNATDAADGTSGLWQGEAAEGEDTLFAGVIVRDDDAQKGAIRRVTPVMPDPMGIMPSPMLDTVSGQVTVGSTIIQLDQIISPRDIIISPR